VREDILREEEFSETNKLKIWKTSMREEEFSEADDTSKLKGGKIS
jgi:hypothetical protein